MNRKLYKKISSKWKGHVYSTYERVKPRLKAVEPYLKLLKGKNVLEWGCNSGLFAYEIAKYAKGYIGVDKSEYCFQQAIMTSEHIENKHVTFLNMRAREFIKQNCDYNAFVSFYVLYHLHDDEVDLLKSVVFPKCDVTINMIRTHKREAHNEFWKLDVTTRFIKDCGFKVVVDVHNNKFSTIIGTRYDN